MAVTERWEREPGVTWRNRAIASRPRAVQIVATVGAAAAVAVDVAADVAADVVDVTEVRLAEPPDALRWEAPPQPASSATDAIRAGATAGR